MADLKTQIVLALSAWVSQRPGLEYGNYGVRYLFVVEISRYDGFIGMRRIVKVLP